MNYLQQKKQAIISAIQKITPNIWDYTLYPITFEQVNGYYTVPSPHNIAPQLTKDGYLISNMSTVLYNSTRWGMKLDEYSKYRIIIGLDKGISNLISLYIQPIICILFVNGKSCRLYIKDNKIYYVDANYYNYFLCNFSQNYNYIKILVYENDILIYGGTNLNNFNYIGKYNMNAKQYFNDKNIEFLVQSLKINMDTYITLKHYEAIKI